MDSEIVIIILMIQASCGLAVSTLLLVDYIIHKQQNYVEMSLLTTNSIQQLCIIILYSQSQQNSCLATIYIVQTLSLSSLMWIIMILQKSYLLTRYGVALAIEQSQTNSYWLQFIIAVFIPAFTNGLMFVDLPGGQCSATQQLVSVNRLYWTIDFTITLVALFIIIFNVLKIHLMVMKQIHISTIFEKNLFWSIVLLLIHLPLLIYSEFLIDRLGGEDIIFKSLFLLKNNQIFIVSILYGLDQSPQTVYICNAVNYYRGMYFQKYRSTETEANTQGSIEIAPMGY